jgi:hypothetical protein
MSHLNYPACSTQIANHNRQRRLCPGPQCFQEQWSKRKSWRQGIRLHVDRFCLSFPIVLDVLPWWCRWSERQQWLQWAQGTPPWLLLYPALKQREEPEKGEQFLRLSGSPRPQKATSL